MRYALHYDKLDKRLASYVVEAKSCDPQQAQAELRAGVAAADEAFTRDHGHPFLLGNITLRPEFLGE